MRNTPLIIVIILIVLIGAGVYALNNNTTANTSDNANLNATDTMPMPGDDSTVGTSSATGTTVTTGSSTTGTSAKTATVAIKNFAYVPTTLTIKTGTKVTWTNNDSAPHTVTSVTGSVLDSPTLATGQAFSYTFTKAGTYNYYCTIHPNMKATVVVTD